MLFPLLLGLGFLSVGWWLYRGGYRWWGGLAGVLGLAVLGLTLAVYAQDVGRVQARHDLDVLLRELGREDLYARDGLRDVEETLFLFSMASQALYRATDYADSSRRGAIDSCLRRMAVWVTQPGNLEQWRRGPGGWGEETFFMAHACSVLGHYQLVTGEEDRADRFVRLCTYLSRELGRAHYKHLPSHPEEELLRPADNAAAVYALSLHDAYYGSNLSEPALTAWTGYLDRELYHAESRLPCAAFTATNRCSLEPSATATGLYICYRAAAAPGRPASDIPFREWLHYFKRFSGSPFGVSIRPNMRRGQVARQCNTGANPLECGRYEEAIGLWAAAEYGGRYTYFRLLCGYVFDRWLSRQPDYAGMRPARRVEALTEVAIRGVAY